MSMERVVATLHVDQSLLRFYLIPKPEEGGYAISVLQKPSMRRYVAQRNGEDAEEEFFVIQSALLDLMPDQVNLQVEFEGSKEPELEMGLASSSSSTHPITLDKTMTFPEGHITAILAPQSSEPSDPSGGGPSPPEEAPKDIQQQPDVADPGQAGSQHHEHEGDQSKGDEQKDCEGGSSSGKEAADKEKLPGIVVTVRVKPPPPLRKERIFRVVLEQVSVTEVDILREEVEEHRDELRTLRHEFEEFKVHVEHAFASQDRTTAPPQSSAITPAIPPPPPPAVAATVPPPQPPSSVIWQPPARWLFSSDGRTVTYNGTKSWESIFLSTVRLTSHGASPVSSFTFRVDSLGYSQNCDVFIGVSQTCFSSGYIGQSVDSWGIQLNTGNKYTNGMFSPYDTQGKVTIGEEITVCVDALAGTLQVARKGRNLGTAFVVNASSPLFVGVSMYNCGCSLTLLQ